MFLQALVRATGQVQKRTSKVVATLPYVTRSSVQVRTPEEVDGANIRILYMYVTFSGDIRYNNRSNAVVVRILR